MRGLLLLVTLPLLADAAVAYSLSSTPAVPRAGVAVSQPPMPARSGVPAATRIAVGRQPGGDSATPVFFDWNQAALSPHGRMILADAARAALHGRPLTIRIQSADNPPGHPVHAALLLQARWRSVGAELERDGVSPGRIVKLDEDAVSPPPRPSAVAVLALAQAGVVRAVVMQAGVMQAGSISIR